MKKNILIETFNGVVCNLEVDLVKSEENQIVIRTWDNKLKRYKLINDRNGSYYEYSSNIDNLQNELFS
jgi:hypothetical protein